MKWEHKGIEFTIEVEPLGPFFLVSARAPQEGMFVRVRPFSALAQTQEQALEQVKSQIRVEYRRLPELVREDS